MPSALSAFCRVKGVGTRKPYPYTAFTISSEPFYAMLKDENKTEV